MDVTKKHSPLNPAETLAALVKEKLEIDITPNRMRWFIARHWDLINILSHAIHNEEKAKL